ncbi:MAG: DUF3320 domain-containing protein [Bacteroidota bacterium]
MDNLSKALLKTDFTYTSILNFALQQNHVPVIKSLKILNNAEKDLQNIDIEIYTEPEFTVAWKQTIQFLRKDESFEFGSIPIAVQSKYLAELTERVAGNITIKLRYDGEETIEHYPIEILAYDQWNGINLLPEMLAAFITPNHPDIFKIIRNAAGILERWTGSPSFDEYQSRNPDRVMKQMAAIFEAIAEMQLIYCSVPASFEETGQRIRLADTIFTNKLANCLDLSLLYAACLEAVGIRPLIIITKGHAFCGAWLIDETFADAVNDDASLITKRIAEGISEIAIVESTCMNAGMKHSFDTAVEQAMQKINEDFILFLDVKRARYGSVRPLPLRILTPGGWEIKEEVLAARNNESPEDIYVGQKLQYTDKIDVSRQLLWERKLLDLTLRNSLLNLRVTKSVIQFITIDAAKLEDALANGSEFHMLPRPSDWDNPLRDAVIYKKINNSDPISDLVKHELQHNKIRTFLPEQELSYSLTTIYRASRTSMEENGANTLYIGLGLLKWYETEASERPRYAPILLIPIEIVRKSALKGYIIKSREEETIMNITLLEMLRQDFGLNIGGLETLPKDQSGVDVKSIFNTIRQLIMGKSRWDVEEQAILGNFSFSKFILWNDIHNNSDKLLRNKLVASLVSGKLEWDVQEEDNSEAILDDKLHPAALSLPISTDSSQLQAIISSSQNKSFVLHGPPGTGKSQTITNIIANALYQGKKVLFVAAKKAALEVVESRLEAIGIGSFCLELHSNKSKKSEVLQQLKAATEVQQKHSPQNYLDEAGRLFDLRSELNQYVEALHKKQRFGYSLFELFSNYGQIKSASGSVRFPAAQLENLSQQQFTSWGDITEEMQAAAQLIGTAHNHPLKAVGTTNFTQQLRQDGTTLSQKLISLLEQVKSSSAQTAAALKIDIELVSREQEAALYRITTNVIALPDTPASLLNVDSFEQTLAQIIGVADHGIKRDSLRTELRQYFDDSVFSISARRLLTEWTMASEKWFIPKWFAQNKLIKALSSHSTVSSINKELVPTLLKNIIALQEEQAFIDQATNLPTALGFLWNNGAAEWTKILTVCNALIQINRNVAGLLDVSGSRKWRMAMAEQFTEGSNLFLSNNAHTFHTYIDLSDELGRKELELNNVLQVDKIMIPRSASNWISSLHNELQGWVDHLPNLKDWISWLQVKAKASQSGLLPLVQAFESGSIAGNLLHAEFLKGFYRSAAESLIEADPKLNTFNGTLFQEKIRKFREISKQFELLTRQELYAKLASRIPSFAQEASQSSEIGFLQRNIRNNGRATSIRKIFDGIPNLLHRITPCMLMSPISVAQYFEASTEKFDLVIFDEASQMPTCEAVGAIARASNVIIVGDPKQMPPTSFFAVNNVDEENIEKEDLESILDDCLALSMPSQHLLWHYRSKHESLIAFSNAKYYDNKLLTFPSMDDISSKVQFVPVEGHYDKGKTRQNKFEADAIIDEIVRRLSDPLLAKKSIGIVTFSSVQQTLIEDKLTAIFSVRPDLEQIALESEEPIFIKNLENVQGDERDIILFSIGYGPDEKGNISLNFGPINRDGGWRRLNVAVSRARYEMMVFSTLKADQIDLNRSRSEGMAGLKAFLAYAEKGKIALPGRTANTADWEPEFENLIAAEVRKHGHEVHTQIGCSAYKIDLAIVNPENKSEYILGILCDGKGYVAAKTSKDREIVQLDVLTALGWNIHKIWSTEWWEKPEAVIAGILKAISEAKTTPVIAHGNTPAYDNTPAIAHPTNPAYGTAPVIAHGSTPVIARNEETKQSSIPFTPTPNPTTIHQNPSFPYEITSLEITTATPSEFINPVNRGKIKAQLCNIVQTEAPISKNLLHKRLLNAWGISRMGGRASKYLDDLITNMELQQTENLKRTFYWKSSQGSANYKDFRISAAESPKREAEDLPPEEVANAIHQVLRNQISLSKQDLMRETARYFGYTKLGILVETYLSQGIEFAIAKGFAKLEGDRVKFLD